MKIATCQYKLSEHTWPAYIKKIESMMVSAKQQNVDLILLPEYAGIEIGDPTVYADKELFASLQSSLDKYILFFQKMAKQYQLYILAGTTIVSANQEKYLNRAYFFEPSGKYHHQDKLQLTQYEKNSGLILQGEKQQVFDTKWGKIGIAICYDSEFPEIVRNLVKAGAWLILVPSYTISLAGYYRVCLSARARAIENQCFVAAVNRVGEDGNGLKYSGDSLLIDALGNESPLSEGKEEVKIVTLKMDELNSTREMLPFLKDR